jgi:hypothetical protein
MQIKEHNHAARERKSVLNTKWMMYGVCHNVVVTAGQYYS